MSKKSCRDEIFIETIGQQDFLSPFMGVRKHSALKGASVYLELDSAINIWPLCGFTLGTLASKKCYLT
jgi:hypothetical protein